MSLESTPLTQSSVHLEMEEREMTKKMIPQKEAAPWKKCGWCWSLHPGGELAILTFAGKDAATEFDMIYPLDVVEKYAPDAIMGVVGNGKAKRPREPRSEPRLLPPIWVIQLRIWRLGEIGGWRLSTTRQEFFGERLIVHKRWPLFLNLDIIYGICATILILNLPVVISRECAALCSAHVELTLDSQPLCLDTSALSALDPTHRV